MTELLNRNLDDQDKYHIPEVQHTDGFDDTASTKPNMRKRVIIGASAVGLTGALAAGGIVANNLIQQANYDGPITGGGEPITVDPDQLPPEDLGTEPDPNNPVAGPSPSDIPNIPEVTPEVPTTDVLGTFEVVKGQNNYEVSNEDYAALVESLKVKLPADATAEQVAAAMSEKLTAYMKGGQTVEDRQAREGYASVENPDYFGWNVWSNDLHTAALKDALFMDNIENAPGNPVQNLSDLKTEMNRIWANTIREGQTPYDIKVQVTFENTAVTTAPIGFQATGDLIYTDNATSSPIAENDSQSFKGTATFEGMSFDVMYDDDGDWIFYNFYRKQ